MKRLFSNINSAIFAIALGCVVSLSACNSETTIDPSAPREILCELKFTGATYAPFHRDPPYKYALYDINGKFVAYMETSKLVVPRMDVFMGKCVIVRGQMQKLDGENVMRAESILIKN